MKTRFVVEIESKNINCFVPDEGAPTSEYTKKELDTCKKEAEELFHSAIKVAFKDILQVDSCYPEFRDKIIEMLEEVAFNNGELPEADSFKDIGELSFNILEYKKKVKKE